jgi:tRNA threonylcarbamoyladenosine biosynthesis protein TsaB
LRAGLAAARGLALATGLPAIGVSTLETAAHAVSPQERKGSSVLVAIDTRRDDLFVQGFAEDLRELAPASVANAADAASNAPPGPRVLAGDATAPLAAALRAIGRDPNVARAAGAIDVTVVARLAAQRLAEGHTPAPLRPLYLRAPDVTPAPPRRAR